MSTRNESRDIERIPIDSSNLASIGYSAEKQTLAVEFRSSGEIIHYAPFTEADFETFCAASSRGRYYALHIRGKVPGKPMTGKCPKCGAQGLIGETCTDCGCAEVLVVDKRRKETGPPVDGSWADAAEIARARDDVDPREEPTGEGRF